VKNKDSATMNMKLMYITNNPAVARIAEDAGVDWIFLDMEVIGKAFRQSGLDTVQNHHTIDDIKRIRKTISQSKLLVRINPIHDAVDNYPSSKDEIDATIEAGADILMLPYFKTVEEAKTFIHLVNGRAKTLLLLETVEAASLIDEILEVPGIDMIHLGLNDLHLELGMKFMFELLANGTVERLGNKIKAKGIPFGFGGIATLDGGALQGSMVLKEHVRLGSSMVIVSRSFCNTDIVTDLNEVQRIFDTGISGLRALEKEASQADTAYLEENRKAVVAAVNKIAGTNY
jgi:2-keto-3-deoxy-L-rhamnonate aldolase RhmA